MKRLLEEDAPNQPTERERMLLESIVLDVPPEGAAAALMARLETAPVVPIASSRKTLRVSLLLVAAVAGIVALGVVRKRHEPVPIVQEQPLVTPSTPIAPVVPAMEAPLPPAAPASAAKPAPTVSVAKRPAPPAPAPAPALSTLLRQASGDAGRTEVGQAFDRGAVARALGQVNLDECRSYAGPSGAGHVIVTFETDGHVDQASVDPPFAGTARGGCVAAKFAAVRVPPFEGTPVRVGKSFALQ